MTDHTLRAVPDCSNAPRKALLIVNSHAHSTNDLLRPLPGKKETMIAASTGLLTAAFVTTCLLDASAGATIRELQQFTDSLADGDVALLYFSGYGAHGTVDDPDADVLYGNDGVPLRLDGDLLGPVMRSHKLAACIVVLECCATDPRGKEPIVMPGYHHQFAMASTCSYHVASTKTGVAFSTRHFLGQLRENGHLPVEQLSKCIRIAMNAEDRRVCHWDVNGLTVNFRFVPTD